MSRLSQAGKLYEQAYKLVRSELLDRVYKVLCQHHNIKYCIIGMGGIFFVDKDDNHLDPDDRSYMKPISTLLVKWNDFLHLTGDPAWISVGPRMKMVVKTEW